MSLTAAALALLLSLSAPPPQTTLQDFFDGADRFFAAHVEAGAVRYAALTDDPTALDELVAFIETTSPDEIADVAARKAYLIDAYNLLVIHSVVEHYPVDSPLDVPGFFDRITHRVGDRELTLDQIEKEVLFGIEPDPRFHFALVCAAVGCPEIVPWAYRPGALDRQLDRRAEEIVNDPKHVEVDHTSERVRLSEIFDWYADHFEQRHDEVIGYVNEYRYERIPPDYARSYVEYDWRLNDVPSTGGSGAGAGEQNLQSFTPAVLLAPGQLEVKVFNNLYTQTAFFDGDRERRDEGLRSTFFTSLISVLYGASDGLNAGLELWVRSVRNGAEDSSPFALFEFAGPPDGRTAVTRLGPKVKFAPFGGSSLSQLSIQSTLLVAVGDELSGASVPADPDATEPYLDDDAHIWLTQLFWDRRLGERFSLFGEVDTWVRIDRDFESGQNRLDVPLKLFLSYYPTRRVTLYGMHEFNHQWSGEETAFYSQAGVGAKLQIVPEFEVEALLTTFYWGRNAGAGSTFNLGFRFVTL